MDNISLLTKVIDDIWYAVFTQLDFKELAPVRAVCQRWFSISMSPIVLDGIKMRRNEIRFRAVAIQWGMVYHLRTVLCASKPLSEPTKDPIPVAGYSSLKLISLKSHISPHLKKIYSSKIGKVQTKFLVGTFTQDNSVASTSLSDSKAKKIIQDLKEEEKEVGNEEEEDQGRERLFNGIVNLTAHKIGEGELGLGLDSFTLKISRKKILGVGINCQKEEDIEIKGVIERVFDRTDGWWWKDLSTPKM